MRVSVKLLNERYVELGWVKDIGSIGITGDCSNKQQFIWSNDSVLTTVNTFEFIQDLICITDNSGKMHYIDSNTSDSKISEIDGYIISNSYGIRKHCCKENNHINRKIILKDISNTRYEIIMNKEPYEVSVTMY